MDQVVKDVFLLFSVYFWLQTCHSYPQYTMPGDSLKPGDILNHTTQLCSTTSIFCMYFDKSDDPNFSYLRIIRKDDDTIVWFGNRKEQVVNNSGELTLDLSGELKIVSQGKPIEILYSPNRPINNTVATLSDKGNFELKQLYPNGSTNTVLWQSFDYPTMYLLPEMKVGVNHKTGHNWSLVSRITYRNPSEGDYTLVWEPIHREVIILVRGLILWKSGSYRNGKGFRNMLAEIHNLYDFNIVSNEEEDSFTFTPRNKSNDRFLYWYLSSDGSISDALSTDIARADKCYGFNEEDGCQKLNMSTCWSPIGKYVEPLYGYFNFPDNRSSKYVQNDTNSGLTNFDCMQRCWRNCDCVGFYTIYDNSTGCTFLHKSALHFLQYNIHPDDRQLQQIYLLKGPSRREGRIKWIWKSVVIAISLFIICLFIIRLAIRKRKIILEERNQKSTQPMMLDFLASNESTSVNDLQREIKRGQNLTIFSYESVMEATNSFSLENKLGQGGFGPVYKGILPTGKEVAVKRLSKTSGQGVVEFKNELTFICELQHMNLVQLLGSCIHEEEKILIYEYMPNKSLDFFLFGSTQSKLLDWHTRFNIIDGVAQGLLYLHKYSRLKVIHRDLKASNILLDENMNPKISDFGMARMFTQHELKVNTDRIVGTYGYMSPEYAMEGICSTKSDIYSFGVLLLEIISGRRNNSFYNDNGVGGPLNLVGHAWDLWKEGVALQLMDPTLDDSYVYEEVLRCIHIGILCVEEDPNDRPTMSHIVSMLVNKSATLPFPKRPAIVYVRRNMFEGAPCFQKSHVSSIYEVSLTVLDGRP